MRVAQAAISPSPVIHESKVEKVDRDQTVSSETRNVQQLVNQLSEQQSLRKDEEVPKEKVLKAVDAMNQFLEVHNRNSKFILHDGLGEYYVQVVDAKTEEVIREVPPKKLLDAFYTMQKFLGMLVDEKI